MTTKDRGEWRNLHSKGNKIPKVLKALQWEAIHIERDVGLPLDFVRN